MPQKSTKTVSDSMGQLEIPSDAYYGAQTARAMENFPISKMRLPAAFIRAQGLIKWAAARTHDDLGLLPHRIAHAIAEASQEVMQGDWNASFCVDVYQAGAGTSQNMNANEVIATRATELIRDRQITVHANDHVNMSQSTNDTIHVAMNISTMEMLAHQLDPALARLEQALDDKGKEFADIVKAGRTHLQDAVPMRLGDEFHAYAANVRRHRKWLEQSSGSLLAIGLGGNAVGTGINTHPEYGERAVAYIKEATGLDFQLPENPFMFNQNPDEIVYVAGVLRTVAQALCRLANDIRLLSSGPRTGLGELDLPAVQPGSSIMPGKVNPVMAEMLNMVSYQVMGCYETVAQAGNAGQLELNVMMPVMAANVLHMIHILASSSDAFTERLVKGITANKEKCRYYADHTLSLATALNTELGYEAAAKIVKHALEHNQSLYDAGQALGVSSEALSRALDVDELSRPIQKISYSSPNPGIFKAQESESAD